MLSIQLSPTIGSALIVGGGTVAKKKLTALLEANFQVEIVTKEISFEIPKNIKLTLKNFEDSDLDSHVIVFACTDNTELNSHICVIAKQKNKLVQNASLFEEGNFINPAVLRSGDITVAVSTNGYDPKLSVEIRDEIKKLIEDKEVNKDFSRRTR